MDKNETYLADWSCPGREKPDDRANRLPKQQNLEAVVYGRRLMGMEYKGLSSYCVHRFGELKNLDFDLLSAPEINQVIQSIRKSDKEIILEIEAPFSVLAGIMDPMDLYACPEEKVRELNTILQKIANAQNIYISACVKAGCKTISLADPVGSLNLVGETFFKRIVGKSQVYLLNQCVPYASDVSWNLCPLMDRSLEMTGMKGQIMVPFTSRCMNVRDSILQGSISKPNIV